MEVFDKPIDVNKDNYLLVAAKYYNNPQCTSTKEFNDDLKRVKYAKRLIHRYHETGELCINLLMNHIIVFYNVFGIEVATKLLAVKLELKHWVVIKPILLYLKYTTPSDLAGIEMDKNIIEELRKL